MKILHLEDNAFKQFNIANQLRGHEIDLVSNLRDGLDKLPGEYDLIITDMWYPQFPGGKDHKSGEELIQYLADNNIATPVILISSVDYEYPIFGNIHYDEDEDWERELAVLISKLKNK